MRGILDKPIYLTGFMATGKSKVGILLADRLGRGFLDTDEMIIEAAGESIPDIFENEGEAAFRQYEYEAILETSRKKQVVVSLGGGAITQQRNWDVIRSTGVCMCFTASIDTIFERVRRKASERPLLAGLDDIGLENKIRNMLEEREPYYKLADIFVASTDDRSPEQTAELALAALTKMGS